MKKTNNVTKVFIAAIALFSVMGLNSCNKNMQDKTAVQGNAVDNSTLANPPVAYWKFDSSWSESVEHLKGVSHNRAKYSSTAQAHDGTSAFLSSDSGYVTYNSAGTALPNITTGLTVDFWMFAFPKEGGAQCVWCLPQTGAFWPDMNVLLDGYNKAQKDTGLIKVMFKANRAIPYNEEWQVWGNIPNFYRQWTRVQYSYNGATSKFILKINNRTIANDTLFTDAVSNGGVPLGNIEPNPGTHGIVMGAFQNTWDPVLFGDPQPWMLGFKGRIDNFKIYDKALF